jgi:hypothetical protein
MNQAVSNPKNVPNWLIAGAYFAIAALPTILVTVLIAPGRLCEVLNLRWVNTQTGSHVMFIVMCLSSAFVAGSSVGSKWILNDCVLKETTFKPEKILFLGFCTVLTAQVVFTLESLMLSKYWLQMAVQLSVFQWMQSLAQTVLVEFYFTCWMTVPSGMLAAWLLARRYGRRRA